MLWGLDGGGAYKTCFEHIKDQFARYNFDDVH